MLTTTAHCIISQCSFSKILDHNLSIPRVYYAYATTYKTKRKSLATVGYQNTTLTLSSNIRNTPAPLLSHSSNIPSPRPPLHTHLPTNQHLHRPINPQPIPQIRHPQRLFRLLRRKPHLHDAVNRLLSRVLVRLRRQDLALRGVLHGRRRLLVPERGVA